jgi:hypothetical protein
MLRRRRLAPAYVPPISVILAANKERYISGLAAYREGRVEAWLEVFAVSAEQAAHLARRYLSEVQKLQEKWRSMVRQSSRIRADAAAWKLIDVLPAQPIVTLPAAVARIERTKPAVNQAIEQLVAADVLIPTSDGKRNRAWEASGLLDLLMGLESGEAPDDEADPGPIPDVSKPDNRVSGAGDQAFGPAGRRRMTPLPFTDPIYRLAPGAWLTPPGEDADITFRLAVAAPNVLPLGGSASTQLVTQLRGQRREDLLVELLHASPITEWLRSLRSIWHWSDDAEWTPVGTGSPEFTELWFSPFGIDNRRPAFMARCGFATGVVDAEQATAVPSIDAAFDLMLNVRELGADRGPTQIRSGADELLAPAALSLVEVANTLGHLFGFVAVAMSAAGSLLPPPRADSARVGTWVSVSGGLADRVIDLRAFRRIPRSTGMSQTADGFRLDLPESQLPDNEIRAFVANLLYEGLERGGYRGLDEAIDELRRGPVLAKNR